jgi:hypothetical protein
VYGRIKEQSMMDLSFRRSNKKNQEKKGGCGRQPMMVGKLINSRIRGKFGQLGSRQEIGRMHKAVRMGWDGMIRPGRIKSNIWRFRLRFRSGLALRLRRRTKWNK